MSVPTLQIVKFETRYVPDRNDGAKLRPVDWVWIGPVGGTDRTCTPFRVRDLLNLKPLATNDPASVLAHNIKDIVARGHSIWKSGQELPDEGTPLAAWNAITQAQADVLKAHGFKSVESIAAMTDAHVQRIPLPMRDLIRQAKAFLEAAETNRVAQAIEVKDRQIEALNAETKEQSEQIRSLMEKVNALADMVAEAQAEKKAEAAPAGKKTKAA